MQYLKVPDDRTNLFETDTLDEICDETGVTIELNEDDQNIKIEHDNSITEMDIKHVVKALFLGFSYTEAIQLFRDPMSRFEIINIKDETRNYKEFKRQKGRVIGENGKAKRVISDLTEASIEVHDDKVAIIGSLDDAIKAREAVMKLLSGSPHAHVYRSLERYKRKKNKQKLM